jgi:hypothetical protein
MVTLLYAAPDQIYDAKVRDNLKYDPKMTVPRQIMTPVFLEADNTPKNRLLVKTFVWRHFQL